MSGMWLGTIFVNTSFTRVSAIGVTDFLIEVSDTIQMSPELESKILEAFKQSHGRKGENLSLDQLLEVLDEIPRVEVDQLLRRWLTCRTRLGAIEAPPQRSTRCLTGYSRS